MINDWDWGTVGGRKRKGFTEEGINTVGSAWFSITLGSSQNEI